MVFPQIFIIYCSSTMRHQMYIIDCDSSGTGKRVSSDLRIGMETFERIAS